MTSSTDLSSTVEDRPLVCVAIPLKADDDDSVGPSHETLWAERLDSGYFRLNNVPAFADDYHFGDVVACDTSDPNELPRVLAVVMGTHHETWHVEIYPSEEMDREVNHAHGREVWERLTAQFPVHIERGWGWLHIDVPPGDFRDDLDEMLEELHEQGLIAEP